MAASNHQVLDCSEYQVEEPAMKTFIITFTVLISVAATSPVEAKPVLKAQSDVSSKWNKANDNVVNNLRG
jgi:hypothetical protein